MHFCGGQNKDHIGGRFLQGLQQCVKCPYGEHMHLVYNINLVFALCRRIGYLLHNFTDIIHAVIGGGIYLDHIHAGSRRDRLTDAAFPAGTVLRRILTIHRACKDFRHGRLSRSPCTGKQIGMSDTVCLQLVFQGSHNMILPLYIHKSIRAKLSV